MLTSSISLFSPSSVPVVAPQGTQKPKNKTDEAAQKELSELSANATSTALINPNQVRKFKDQTSPILYDLFYKALHEALGSYQSTTNHYFVSPLLTLIAEYEDDLISSLLNTSAPTPLSIRPVAAPLSMGTQFVSSIGFGKKMWNDYFGDIGEAPPLPKDICAILTSACPFFPGKTVAQTHILALVPATLKGTPMTLKRLGELMLKLGKSGYNPHCGYLKTHAETPFEKSHWVLMTNNVPEETRDKSYAVQKGIIEGHANYQVPKLAQATVAIFMEYVATGIYRYGQKPWTYTRCQEVGPYGQMIVGGFAPVGLIVNDHGRGDANVGVAALRKLV